MNRVSMVGVGVGALSFALSFVHLKPNRIASGEGLFAWEVLGGVELLVLVLPWLMVIVLSALSHFSPTILPAFLEGCLGNTAIVLVFFFLGKVSARLHPPDMPYARTSMGPGVWFMIFGGYILIISSLKRLSGFRIRRLIVTFGGLAFLSALVASGHLAELSMFKEYAARRDKFIRELVNHMLLSGSAVAGAMLIGIPLGIWAWRKRVLEKPVFFLVNTVQTIPGLALFGLMIAPLAVLSQKYPLLREVGIRGVGPAPALLALTFYALLPITRNTYTSLKVIGHSIIESAQGVGMNRMQILFRIEVPLSIPIILGGIRISSVQAVGNTVLAALIGAGGLGVFVFQGLGQAASDLILLGAIPPIILAVVVDKMMQALINAVTPRGISRGHGI
ncbi:MAG: ABC transporter permease [Spirochaetota bacterium]